MSLLKSTLSRLVPRSETWKTFFSTMNFNTIGTHNGTFHCDEVIGCFLLKLLCKDARIVRSRDTKVLDECDVVLDVGAVYDPSKLRFDHHQKGFDHTLNSLRPEMPYTVKLSSAGLIYCHYGEEIIKAALGEDVDKEALPHIYKKVYDSFIMEIDGIDNGVPMYDGEPRYSISTSLSKRVGHLNKKWNDTESYDETAAFHKAMDLAGSEFLEKLNYIYKVWWSARKEVIKALDKRLQVHESGEIIELDVYVPFIEHLLILEKEMDIQPAIKYVLYCDGTDWRIRAVPIASSSFVSRLPLLESWRGKRDAQLAEIASSPGIIFVHVNGFIGGHKTREGVIDMAVRSLAATN